MAESMPEVGFEAGRSIPSIPEVATRQYGGQYGINAQIRLSFIDKYVQDERDIRKEAVDLIDAPPDGVVIDIGCSRGSQLRDLRADRRYMGLEVGVDLDISTLSVAAVIESTSDLQPNSYVAGDMSKLPFRAGSVDSILNSFALHHAKELPSAIAELCRVLKFGGQLIVLANSIEQKQEHTKLLELVGEEEGAVPPDRFAVTFNTEMAADQLSPFFEIVDVIPQETELHVPSEGLDDLVASVETYYFDFDPKLSDLNSIEKTRIAQDVIVPYYIRRVAEQGRGIFVENIKREIIICRKSL